MTDIFFSYSSKDREAVRPVCDALTAQGFDVFWDQSVPAGVDWDTWIRQHLAKAKCAVVFWSKNSVASDNVRHEATVAKEQGKLVPVLLENLAASEFPMGMWSTQGANLANFVGGSADPEWQKLLREIETRLTPLWARRAMDGLEAQLVAERARREAAERRDQTLQNQITQEAQAQQELKRERDHALGEVAALKAQLAEAARARAELDARAVSLGQQRNQAEMLQTTLEEHKQQAARTAAQLKKEIADLKAERDRLARIAGSRPIAGSEQNGHADLPSMDAESIGARLRRGTIAVLLLVGVWEAVAFISSSPLLPHITQIAASLVRYSTVLLQSLAFTLLFAGVGFAFGTGAAMSMERATRLSGWLREPFAIIAVILRWLPLPGLMFLATWWFGIGGAAVVAAVATLIARMTFGSHSRPAASWHALRASAQASLMWCVAAEAFGSRLGVGYLMSNASSAGELIAVIIVLVVASVAIDLLLKTAQLLTSQPRPA